MIADYSSEIKIAILQSILERQSAKWRSIVKLRPSRGRNARFNSVKSEIIGWKLTKFVHIIAI